MAIQNSMSPGEIVDQHTAQYAGEDDTNLIEAGMNSLAVMRVANLLRRSGARDVTFAKLMEQPTKAAWRSLAKANGISVPDVQVTIDSRGGDRKDSEPFPLTDIQHAYFVGRQDAMPMGGNGCHAYLELKGKDIDARRLQEAWTTLFEYHPMLRARFTADGKQYVAEEPSGSATVLAVHDLSDLPGKEADTAFLAIRQELSQRKLDVEAGQTCGLALVNMPKGRARICFDIDLLVCDVQSFQVLIRDLALAYSGEGRPSADPAWDFADYLQRQEERRAQEAPVRARDEEYWMKRIPELPAGPHLPTVVDPDTVTSPRYGNYAYQIAPHAYECLKERAAKRGETVAMVLLAAFSQVLAAWSENQHFLVNLPVFARDTGEAGIENVVSDFSDILLLEVDASKRQTFEEFLGQVSKRFISDMDHLAFNGIAVQRAVAAAGGPQSGLAPVVFACNLGDQLLAKEVPESLGSLAFMTSQTPQVQIDCQVFDHENGLRLSWDVAEELYPQGMCESMFDAFCSLVERLSTSEDAWLCPPIVMPEEQRQRRDADVVAMHMAVPDFAPLHAAFLACAQQAPDATALLDAATGVEVSYGEVYRRAANIACLLVGAGVKRGSLVAVSLERGVEQVCSLLGVVMAGCAYVPIDVAQPSMRKQLMKEKLGLRYELTDSVHAEKGVFDHVFFVEDSPAYDAGRAAQIVQSRMPKPDDTAYVIMTSGSTGEPKGVEVSHGSAWNTISDVSARLGVSPGDKMLAVSNYDFDLSVYDVFGMLGAGATLVLMSDDARRDAGLQLEYVARHRISLWNTVPMLLDMLVTAAENEGATLPLRAAMLSGDWIGLDLPKRLAARAPSCRMVAMGGATEAAIWSNWQEVPVPVPDNWRSIPYGRPLRAQCYRVVDERGEDRPDWVIGELIIGGAGIAKGYRGDKLLTEARFFRERGTTWYRTGDMGRFWEDGTIEFLGRRDFQVKVRGHRIELGEVESAIAGYPEVVACVACAVSASRYLAAVVQMRGGATFDAGKLEAYLRLRLPDYMIPSRFVPIDAMPLAANGKVDRKQLTDLINRHEDAEILSTGGFANATEMRVAQIWERSIGVDVVSRDDTYFEIGGNSLTAVRIIGAVRDEFHVRIDTADIFTHATVASLSSLVDDRVSQHGIKLRETQIGSCSLIAEDVSLPAFRAGDGELDESFALTPLQRAYLIGRQNGMVLGGQSTRAYFEVVVEDLDMTRLNRAVTRLAEVQGSLRLSVNADDATQIIAKRVPPIAIPLVDVSHLDEAEWLGFIESRREELFSREFSLERGLLWEMEVTRWNNEWHIHFCHDGMVLDGWSAECLFDMVEEAYHGTLEGPDFSYRDYVLWLGQVKCSEAYTRDEGYWLEKAAQFPEEQALEPLVPPETIKDPVVANESRIIPEDVCNRVRIVAAEHGMTSFSVMLTAFGKALEAYGGRHDFLINTPISFRPQTVGAEKLLGECSDYRLFRYSSRSENSLWRTAELVASQLADESRHLAFRGSDLSRALQQDRGAEIAAPIVFTSTADVGTGKSDWYRKVLSRTHTSQVWLDVVVMPASEGLALSVDYVEGLLDPKVVQGIADSFIRALHMVAYKPDSWNSLRALSVSPEDRALIDNANATDAPLEHWSYAPLLRKSLGSYSERLFVKGGGDPLTYRQLEQLMGRIGAAIEGVAEKVGAGSRVGVGIAVGKGVAQIAAALACSALGRPFMPIDTEYPPHAVRRCVEGAGLALVIVDDSTKGIVSDGIPVLNIEHDLPASGELLWRESNGDDILAIINTSGTTGNPKSIQLTNEGVVNCLLWSNKRFGVDEDSCGIAITNFAHDMALYDTLGLVLAGAGLVVLSEDTRREPRAWAKLLDEHGVTHWNSVPALMRMLLEAGGTLGERARNSLACVVHGGDWLDLGLAQSIMEAFPDVHLFNVGGPTETTIWNIAHEVTESDVAAGEIPYGKPIQNTRYRVLDDRMNECPVGVAGIMYVAGLGVSPGYLGYEDDSRAFCYWNGTRMCRTGDRGLFLPTGELQILGRDDLQVKVNGKRIEIGGVERLLGKVEGVRSCVAVVNEAAGRLVAYYVGNAVVGEEGMRAELSRKLPPYMIPTRFIALESMPLTRNGKPDRKLLSTLELPEHGGGRVVELTGKTQGNVPPILSEPVVAQAFIKRDEAMQNATGDSLAEVLRFCREVIGDETITPDDNFFEVGGDSLAAMKIGSWAFERFGVELSVVTIMTQPTVREWVEVITKSERGV